MNKRPTWQLFAPLVLMGLATGIHFYGMVAVICWTSAGFLAFMATGRRVLSSYGHAAEWRHGWRKVVVVAYNLFWWPWVISR